MSTQTPDIDHGSRGHHPYSPSSLQPREYCAGYKGEDGNSEASLRGTRLHEHVEQRNLEGLDDDELVGVQFCLNYLDDLLARMPGGQFLPENRWSVDDEETTAGFADVVIVSADRKKAIVADWKMGNHGVEDAESNLQGWAYALGVLHKFPTLEEIEIHFILPFQDKKSHYATFTKEDFGSMLLRVKTVVARAKEAAATFAQGITPASVRPSVSNCLFCARKATCQALHTLVLAPGKKYADMEVPAHLNPAYLTDPVEAGKALRFLQVAEAAFKAARSGITDRVLASEDFLPDGYQLVTTVRRSITDKKGFYDTCIQYGLTPEEVMQTCDFSFGPVEKIISAKAARGKKSEAVEEFALLLKENNAVKDSDPIPSLRQKKTKEIDVGN